MENEPCLYYVSRTWVGDEGGVCSFNVTRLTESYVISLIEKMDLFLDLQKNHDAASLLFWDSTTCFVVDEWELLDGEENPRCVFFEARLCDIPEVDAQQAFIRSIPHSLEQGISKCYNRTEKGKRVRMETQRLVVSSCGVYWQGRRTYESAEIETYSITKGFLVQLRDWLATARQIQENS